MLKRLAIMLLLSGFAYGTGVAVTPFSNGKPQFFNGNTVCSGCLLYTYAAATTTPQATYTDSTGTVANANPVVMDSNGYASIWLQALSYKFVLQTSAGATIWTLDVVNPFNFQPVFTAPISITDATPSESAVNITTSAVSGIGLTIANGNTSSIGLSINSASANGSITVNNTSGSVFNGTSSGAGTAFSMNRSGGNGLLALFSNSSSGNIAQFNNNASTPILLISQSGATITGTESITGQLTSTLATGTAPLVVTSTTPVPNLTGQVLLYNTTGTQQANAHSIIYSGALVSGTPSALTVTLTGASVFTSNATYRCSFGNETTSTNGLKITYTSGSAFTITGPNTVTDTVGGTCTGN